MYERRSSRFGYWHRRSSRRRFIGSSGAVAAGAAGFALVGCGDDDDDNSNGNGNSETPGGSGSPTSGSSSSPTGTTGPVGNTQEVDNLTIEQFREMYHGKHLKELPGFAKQPKRGGEFVFSMYRPLSFDPTAASASSICSHAIFHNQLVQFDIGDHVENHNFTPLQPDLAQTMPEQPDEFTYTFKLHPGVHFHDTAPVNGREMTAEDIKYSYELLADAPVQQPTFADVESIDIPDNETIVIKTGIPAAYLLNTLVVPYHWIVAPEQVEAGGLDVNPIGTGPFMLENLTDQAGYSVVRNPNYWKKDKFGTQLPYFDRVVYEWIASPVDADAAFRTGQLDHRYPTSYSGWQDLVKSNPEVVTQVTIPAPSAQPYILMNLEKEPFNDVRVRRAMSLAIDRDALIEALAGGMAGYGMPMDQTFLGSEWPLGPEELGNWHHYDPEQAKQLLADAGYPDGIPDTMEVFTSATTGLWFEIFVATFNMWSEIGIKIDHQYSADQSQWQSRFYDVKYDDMMGVTQVGPGFDPDPYTYHALHSESPRNYFHVNDPELDRLTVEQRHEMDFEKRVDLLRQIVDIDLDQVYRIWLINPYKINIRYPYVQNITDVHAAWSPVGWGSTNLELGWFDDDQRA